MVLEVVNCAWRQIWLCLSSRHPAGEAAAAANGKIVRFGCDKCSGEVDLLKIGKAQPWDKRNKNKKLKEAIKNKRKNLKENIECPTKIKGKPQPGQ